MARITQDVKDYDLLVVADEADNFGDDLSYRTTTPRPVAGTQGMVPSAWARPFEQWGATQLQGRFLKQTNRWMTDNDYGAWLAVRAVGEAATRGSTSDPAKIGEFMRGADFDLAGFKGTKLTFRDWDGQLRQPVLLARRAFPGVGLAPAGLPASVLRARYARRRSSRNEVPYVIMLKLLLTAAAADRLCAQPSLAEKIFVSNEKDNTVTVLDGDTLKITATIKTGQRPRDIHALGRWQERLCLRQRFRPSFEVLDLATLKITGKLPSGPDPERFDTSPDGKFLYIANENDNKVSTLDVASGQDRRRDPGRDRARGHGGEPGRQGCGRYDRDHQHGPFHRYRNP